MRSFAVRTTFLDTSGVRNIAFSPDGRTLVTSGGKPTLWDVQGRPRQRGVLEPDGIWDVAFSADGRVMAGVGNFGTIMVWDATTGRVRLALDDEDGEILSAVALSPDGTLLATGSFSGGIKVRNAETGALAAPPFPGWAGGPLNFSSDGRLLVALGTRDTVLLWDVGRRGLTRAAARAPASARLLAFSLSPDARMLAMTATDGSVFLWDVASRRRLGASMQGHRGHARTVAFSPDGQTLTSGGDDGKVLLWDVMTRRMLGEALRGNPEGMNRVAFAPGGKMLAAVSVSGTVMMFDLASKAAVGDPLPGHDKSVRSLAFSPDSRILASAADDGTVILWDSPTRTIIARPVERHGGVARAVAFSPNGQWLVSAGDDGRVVARDATTGEPMAVSLDHQGPVLTVAFSPDSRTLAAGVQERIVLWNVQTRVQFAAAVTTDTVTSIAFASSGKLLAYSTNRGVRFLDPASGAPAYPGLPNAGSTIWSIAFGPGDQALAAGTAVGSVMLWDVQRRERAPEALGSHRDNVPAIALAGGPRGLLASVSRDGSLALWDVMARKALLEPVQAYRGGSPASPPVRTERCSHWAVPMGPWHSGQPTLRRL